MAPQRRTPVQERGQATQQAVVEGAAAVFDEMGYAKASLSLIADRSGISQGSMYFHFKSKDQIALAVIHEQHARSLPIIEQIVASSAPVIEQLIRISRGVAEQLLGDPVVRAGIRLALEEGELSEPAGGFYEEWVTAAAGLLEPELATGKLVSTLSAERLARTLIGYFTGVQMMSYATTARADLMASVADLWQLVVDGIVPADARPQVRDVISEVFT